jgi:hypothetical protein
MDDDVSAERIEQIRRRLAAATPGPWSRHGADVHADVVGQLLTGRDGSSAIRAQADRDAEFVAHAHSDIALLLHLVTAGGESQRQGGAMQPRDDQPGPLDDDGEQE